jgi:BolA protein
MLLRRAMAAGAANGAAAARGPVATAIERKLRDAFAPQHLEVLNESHMHRVPRGSETHFKVVVVSAAFEARPLLDRHRAVNAALAQELASGVHALSIVARSPTQWAKAADVPQSPACLGGSKADRKAAPQQ